MTDFQFWDYADTQLAIRKYSYIPHSALPNITRFNEWCYVGSWSITQSASKKKNVLREIAIERGEHLLTPSEIARFYVQGKFKDRAKRMRGEQAESILIDRSSPTFAEAGIWGLCSYVDIKAAYYSIISAVGWDVDYSPFRWIRYGRNITDFPLPQNKLARNCLLTVGLPTQLSIWTGKRYITRLAYNASLNLVLWALVQDVLHGVACDMRKVGCYYINTDGYIVPESKTHLAQEVIESWGLESSIKHSGLTTVWGVGSYSIGEHQTKTMGFKMKPYVDTLNYNDWQWLRVRVKKAADLQREVNTLDKTWLGR